MSKRVVLATFGSYGDVNPFLGIARELRDRGYEPVIASDAGWQRHVENANFEFRPVSSGWPESDDPMAAQLAAAGLFSDCRATFNDLLAAVSDADALVTTTLVVPGAWVAQKAGLPWVSAVLEPMSFFSAYDSLLLPFGKALPELKQMAAPLTEPISRIRAELGVPPGGDPFFEDYLLADAVLALFSPLLGNPQPDWPPEAVVTGFVSHDQFSSSSPAPAKLRQFLAAGPPPVVFTLSSDAWISPLDNFDTESMLAAKMLGRRAILIGLNLTEIRNAEVLTLNHVPFSEVFPHAAAIVHHGGIGTSAIALRAGKPTLVVPGSPTELVSYAQPDNAARLARLGVARVHQRLDYNAGAIAYELSMLLSDPSYAIAASAVAQRIALEDGARCACDVIERVMKKSGRPKTAHATRRKGQERVMNNSTSPTLEQANIYLHLLKRALTTYPLELNEKLMVPALRDMAPNLTRQIAHWGVVCQSMVNKSAGYDPVLRSIGLDWPAEAMTMIGLYRLDNIEQCVTNVLRRNVPGDLAETGVWRGGASIFMRAILKAYGDTDRKVWLADSFQGLPKPDADTYPADRDDNLWMLSELAVSLETVKANFAQYGLLDDQVRFLPGWFRDTLPAAPIDKLAVLRLDGDMYESTIVTLRSLYPKISPGGFVIVDDYGCMPGCQQAVNDFRAEEDIVAPLCPIDWTGVYWQVNAPIKAGTKWSVNNRKLALGHKLPRVASARNRAKRPTQEAR